jgi:hypothetical protein
MTHGGGVIAGGGFGCQKIASHGWTVGEIDDAIMCAAHLNLRLFLLAAFLYRVIGRMSGLNFWFPKSCISFDTKGVSFFCFCLLNPQSARVLAHARRVPTCRHSTHCSRTVSARQNVRRTICPPFIDSTCTVCTLVAVVYVPVRVQVQFLSRYDCMIPVLLY